MSKSAVICFVKTPGFSKPKSRLAASIGEEQALKIYLSLIQCISETFFQLEKENLDLIWAVNEAKGVDYDLWRNRIVWTQPEGTLGEKLLAIEERASGTYQNWIFIGSDTPALDASLIRSAIDILRFHDFVAGPSFDGGFYLWGGRKRLTENLWLCTPFSTSETLDFMTRDLSDIRYLPSLPDLDLVEDIGNVKNSITNPASEARHEMLLLLDAFSSKK